MTGSRKAFLALQRHLYKDLSRCSIWSQQGSRFCSVCYFSNIILKSQHLGSFETREVAERVIKDFHSVTNDHSGVKLYLRFADTKAQKQLKQQSQERRSWRSREYSYSVEHTPSPTVGRLQGLGQQISPNSYVSYQSPAGASNAFTPATSVSPP
jgi:hypothetical protein